MADSHAKMAQSTPQEIIISIVAGLLAPLLAIFLIIQLVLGIQQDHKPDASSEAAQKATLSRIKPVAQLAALDANAPKVEKSGQEVYDAVCTSCHAAGALGAPKFDNKGDWAGRLGQGYDTLVKHAIEGIRQMPARGGDGDLSDLEVARAVAYLANSAGASFKAPEAAAPAAVAGAKPDPAKGKAVYEANCAACHAAGVAGAPKLGDKAAWEERVATGYAQLHENALKGIRGMPAKGGNADLAAPDLANAVGYMVVEAGGKL
ncbi:MAG: cytochrome c5 family protein [Burkholderiaceae bacterium]|nr:cytochrome c5 family protein [Burkholderiaceae bacterium]